MIKCKNIMCKYHSLNTDERCTLEEVTIGIKAKCEEYEVGINHYLYYFIEAMYGNFIYINNMEDDMHYCIHYLLRCLPIIYTVDTNKNTLAFRDIEDRSIVLSSNDLYKMIKSDRFNQKEFEICKQEFNSHGLPVINRSYKTKMGYERELGWLSPTGVFIESPWGTHDKTAESIVNNKFKTEFEDWEKTDTNKGTFHNYRDFLQSVKGYVLIHCPFGTGYIVTNMKPLTKSQKEYLYEYFVSIGLNGQASSYLE